jgi:hypothetical protein
VLQVIKSGEGEEKRGGGKGQGADAVKRLVPVGGHEEKQAYENGQYDGQLKDVGGGAFIVLRRLEVTGTHSEEGDQGEDDEDFAAESMDLSSLHGRCSFRAIGYFAA